MSEVPGAYVIRIDSDTLNCAIEAGSDRLKLLPRGDSLGSYVLEATVGLHTFPLVTRDESGLRIQTWNGGTFPVFWRADGNGLLLSNYPHMLFRRGETIEVKAQVVAGRITGTANQLQNPFATTPQLEESSIYRLNGYVPVFQESTLQIDADASFDKIRSLWLDHFSAYAAENRPMIVPLSGGNDSRLILLLAQHAGVQDITTYHEFKNGEESQIAERVAAACGVPLNHLNRESDILERQQRSMSRDFILSSGMNRNNVNRWTSHCIKMLRAHPGARIAGFGAEAHKGKYYRQIIDLDADCMSQFRISRTSEAAAARVLGFGEYHDFHGDYIDLLVRQSGCVYEDTHSRIDFVHYYSYVVNGYGYRGAYLADTFGVDFPQHGTEFLNCVFSMPRAEKEDFRLVRRMLDEFGGATRGIDIVSGNSKSLKQRPSFLQRVRGRLQSMVAPVRGPATDVHLVDWSPQASLTTSLRRVATGAPAPRVRPFDAITAFNYFATLEREYEVQFRLV